MAHYEKFRDENDEVEQGIKSTDEKRLEDTSPESLHTLSTESWEAIEGNGNEMQGEKKVSSCSSETDLKESTVSSKTSENEDKDMDEKEGVKIIDDEATGRNLQYDAEAESEEESYQYTTLQNTNDSSEAVFDGKQTILYPSSVNDQHGESLFQNKLLRNLQEFFKRRRSLTERSPLVKNGSNLECQQTGTQNPNSSPYCEKGNDIPAASGENGRQKDENLSQIQAEEGSSRSLEQSTMSRSDAVKGLSLAFLGAGVMYGLTGVLVRLAGENGVGAVQVLFARSVFQSILFGSVLLWKRVGLRPPPGRVVRCILIAITYCLATFASYEAFNIIPPGSAIATRGACRTIFSLVLAYLIAKEKIHLGDIITLLSCIGGISLIITSGMTSGDKNYILPPGMNDNPTMVRVYGFTLIIFGGLFRSLGLVAVRGAKEDLSTFSVVFYHSSLTVVLSAILLLAVRQPTAVPSWIGVGYVAGVCIASSVATWSSNQAVKYVHPALVSLGQNADVIVSITLQHTILQIPPRAMEICGAGLILLGVCGLTLAKWVQSRKTETT